MSKAIEARRELLANATHLAERYESECGPEADEDLAAQALEHAVATRDYLRAEDAQALLPIVQLSPDHPIAHAKEADYDHWIGFVCQKIDRMAGFEVEVKARGWGDGGPVKVLADDARSDRVYEAVLALRDQFLCETTGLRSTCAFCSHAWGYCTCAFDEPDEWGHWPENARGFDSRDFFVTEPNVSVCGRFFVDPVAYYGEVYVEAAKKYGWTVGQPVVAGES